MILVVGASGYLGGHVVRRLLADGRKVRAASRNPAKLAALQALGADVVAADLVDAGSLERACRGVDAVIAAAHSLTGTGRYASEHVDDRGHRVLIDAARHAGVGRFVYTSAMFASADHPVDFMRSKAAVERHLQQSGVPFTVLRPSAFMEWHVHDLLGKSLVEAGKTTIFGAGTNPMNFVAADDVAAVASGALLDPGAAGATLEVGGPDNVSRNAIAAMYAERLARPVAIRHVPVAAMRALAPIVRPFQPVVARLMRVAVWSETADQSFAFDPSAQRYGGPVTSVRSFVAARVPTAGTREAGRAT
jgi:NADH dehydrogenase